MKHEPPPCGICAHFTYKMSCNDYDRLWEHAQGACQICGSRGEDTARGVLCVDHDPFTAPWAVRGILCNRCNAALELPCLDPQKVARYLADPWWPHMLSAYGVPPEGIREPAIGMLVATGRRLRWQHTGDGCWEHQDNYDHGCWRPRTWAWLNRKYGPHRLRVISGQLALPLGA